MLAPCCHSTINIDFGLKHICMFVQKPTFTVFFQQMFQVTEFDQNERVATMLSCYYMCDLPIDLCIK